jgi:hypothetical protein
MHENSLFQNQSPFSNTGISNATNNNNSCCTRTKSVLATQNNVNLFAVSSITQRIVIRASDKGAYPWQRDDSVLLVWACEQSPRDQPLPRTTSTYALQIINTKMSAWRCQSLCNNPYLATHQRMSCSSQPATTIMMSASEDKPKLPQQTHQILSTIGSQNGFKS